MFTPAQVSDMLQIPVSTLRRYATDYSDYLSDQAHQPGKSRRYTDRDILILEKARQLLQAGHNAEQVRTLLPLTDIDPQPDTNLAKVPGIAHEITALNDQAAELREIVIGVIAQSKDHNQRITTAEELIADLSARLSAIEQSKRKSWLRKLIDRLDNLVE